MASDMVEFPPYPSVSPLPEGMDDAGKREFALALIAEQGASLGDYLFAATQTAANADLMMRWVEMIEIVASLHDGPVYLSYRACDRIAAESRGRETLQ